jgi:hypothetical protein
MTEIRGRGRAAFAAVLLMVGGFLNIVYGIAAIGNSKFFVHNTHYVFSNLKTWGWITLVLGVLEVLASMSLFTGGEFGRWFGMVIGSLAAIGALLEIPAYPFLSLAIFFMSLWIVHGLAIYHEPTAYQAPDAYREPEGTPPPPAPPARPRSTA